MFVDEHPLYVVTSVFNSRRTRARIKHYKNFSKYIRDSGAILYTVEVAYGDRKHEVTECGNPHNLQLRTNEEIWLKENALNLVIERLPSDWDMVATIDADITFSRPDWVNETKELLQHYPTIQMFTYAYDLDVNYQIYQRHKGIFHAYLDGTLDPSQHYSGKSGHPGYAHAYKRSALNDLGGLYDTAILGSADRHMALCILGLGEHSYNEGVHPNYKKMVSIYQDRAIKHLKKNIGVLDANVFHAYHGDKANRKYNSRWRILVDHQYDPETDIKKDVQGLYQLGDRDPELNHDIMKYFAGRKEDECIM